MKYVTFENPPLSFSVNTLEISQIDNTVYDAYNVKIDGHDSGSIFGRGDSWDAEVKGYVLTDEDKGFLIDKAMGLKKHTK